MNSGINVLQSKKVLIVLGLIFVIYAILSSLAIPLNETIEDSVIDLQFKLRGSRQVSDDIIFIFIGDDSTTRPWDS